MQPAACVAILVIAGVVATASPSAAQLPPAPPGAQTGMPRRDIGPEKTGTAVLRGRVVAADSGAPLRRAQIRVSSPELRDGRIISTDPEGRFELKDLPAGRYTLNVAKAGYVGLSYGQKRPNEQAKPIELADGQVLDKVDFALPRGSVITGRIVDEFGDPVASATVQVMRARFMNGQRRLMGVGTGDTTDDIGQFRLFGLPPGEYVVTATLRAAALAALGADSADRSGYAPTYYPGTLVAAEAQRVRVEAGVEVPNISFAMIPTRTSKITGAVVDSTGKPLANAIVMVRPDLSSMLSTTGAATTTTFNMPPTSMTRTDGTFTLSNVAPGEYALDVRSSAMMEAGEFGSVNVSVGGGDVAGVTIVTGKGVAARGRIVCEGGAPANLRFDSMQVISMPADIFSGPVLGAGMMGKVKEDGTFEMAGQSGVRKFQPGPRLPTGWYVKSIAFEGVDITDTGYEFKGADDVNGFEITLTNRTTEVTGTVTDAKSNPVHDYTAIVFATNGEKWKLPQTRFVRAGRPDQQGRFKIQNLPPGDYYAVALEFIEQGEEGDPEILERLKRGAEKFTIGEAESKPLTLKLTSVS